ncbi:MAG: hypothetical protein RLY40_1072 [Pseudomonadota bacterium]|jgi:hypothetical protein
MRTIIYNDVKFKFFKILVNGLFIGNIKLKRCILDSRLRLSTLGINIHPIEHGIFP